MNKDIFEALNELLKQSYDMTLRYDSLLDKYLRKLNELNQKINYLKSRISVLDRQTESFNRQLEKNNLGNTPEALALIANNQNALRDLKFDLATAQAEKDALIREQKANKALELKLKQDSEEKDVVKLEPAKPIENLEPAKPIENLEPVKPIAESAPVISKKEAKKENKKENKKEASNKNTKKSKKQKKNASDQEENKAPKQAANDGQGRKFLLEFD